MVIALIAFSVLCISIKNYHIHKNEVRAQMVLDGMNPLMVNCVIEDELNKNPKCIILAVNDGKLD